METIDLLSEKYKHILEDQDEVERVELLKQGLNWGSLASTYITKEDLTLIQNYDKNTTDKVDLLQKHGANLARIFMICLAKFSRSEDLKYVVTLVHEMIQYRSEVPEVLDYFYNLGEIEIAGVSSLPFGPLFALLGRHEDEPYIVSRIGALLTEFLVSFPKVKKETLQYAVNWFKTRLSDDETAPNYYRKQIKVLESLRVFLKQNKYRVLFAQEGGVKPISNLVSHKMKDIDAAQIQVMYCALYCLWLMSFNDYVKEMPSMSEPALIFHLVHLLKTVENEKIVRMSLGILKNLLAVTTEEGMLNMDFFIKNARIMISYGLPQVLQQLKPRHYIKADVDQTENVEELRKSLAKIVDDLTSFEVYKNEVLSRKLDWSSPSHKSQTFWSGNVMKFEENDDEVLHVLRSILDNDDKAADATTLAVACWDVGEFVRFHPRGKTLAADMDLKLPIMKYLSHSDESVSSEALRALQKIMIVNWEYLAV